VHFKNVTDSYIYKPDTRSTKNSETEKKKEWRREKNGKEEEVPLVPREYQPLFGPYRSHFLSRKSLISS
jgi:hypothetical protein